MQVKIFIRKKEFLCEFLLLAYMKKVFLGLFLVFISLGLSAQSANQLTLRQTSGNFLSGKYKIFDLPQQMMVKWYDTLGIEHNDDKVLLYVTKDTLFFDVPSNDTLVEALAYNQIEAIKVFNVGKILLKPLALTSSIFFTYASAGTAILIGYGLASNHSSDRYALVGGALILFIVDVPLFYISKALWTGSNMTYKTEKWKLVNR